MSVQPLKIKKITIRRKPKIPVKQRKKSKQERKISLKDYLDAIKGVDYINSYSIKIAIPKAKKLTSEDQKKEVPQDWKSDSDSHDLVEDLEQKLKVAISEERRRNEVDGKEQIRESEKQEEERRIKNEREIYLDKIKEMLEEARKRNIAKKYYGSVKHQWDLFFITHVGNLESILKKGILSPNNVDKLGIQPKEISNEDIVNTRKGIWFGRKNLADYAHVFFNPRNAFLFQKLKEYTHTKIVIIELTCDVSDVGIYITNKNAAVDGFDSKIDAVSGLDYYKIIPSIEEDTLPIGKRWSKRKNWDSEADKPKLQAECLVPDKISPEHFESIHVYNSDMKEKIQPLLTDTKLKIIVDPFMFFDGGY